MLSGSMPTLAASPINEATEDNADDESFKICCAVLASFWTLPAVPKALLIALQKSSTDPCPALAATPANAPVSVVATPTPTPVDADAAQALDVTALKALSIAFARSWMLQPGSARKAVGEKIRVTAKTAVRTDGARYRSKPIGPNSSLTLYHAQKLGRFRLSVKVSIFVAISSDAPTVSAGAFGDSGRPA